MTFKCYDQDQLFLLPPSLRYWLPDNHLAHFISDVVDELDMKEFIKIYCNSDRGQPPYHPAMMLKVLLYAYCTGAPSSLKIERKTYEDIAFRFLAAYFTVSGRLSQNSRPPITELTGHLFQVGPATPSEP